MVRSDEDPIKKAEALFSDDTDELKALFDEDDNSERRRVAWAAFHARSQIIEEQNRHRRDHPWLLDLICVLYPSKQMHTQAVKQELWERRKRHGIDPPPSFWANARNTYNGRCEGYSTFEERKLEKPELEALFHSPEGKWKGIWAVHHDRALAWLKKHAKTLN